jgi:Uma2 family endonuclease
MRKTIGRYKFTESQRGLLIQSGLMPVESTAKALAMTSQRFTVDEYMQMVEIGVLGKEERVELVDGVILEMAPVGRPHGRRTHRLARLLGRLLTEDVEISVQSTIRLGDHTAPEPDIAILSPQASLDEENIPRPDGILLVVEVAGSSLQRDRGEKAGRYAESGIPELWIFVLENDEIEVSRQPTPDGYADVQVYRRGDTLTIQELPGIQFTVDELLA